MKLDELNETIPLGCISEECKIELILKGKTELVDELFRPYDRRARAIARRFLVGDSARVEDVIQEATVKAYINLSRLRDRERFGSWYLTIVRNLAVDSVKRENFYVDKPSGDDDWDFDSWISNRENVTVEPSERITRSNMAEKVKCELSMIDSAYGEPIRMRYLEDRSYSEIADTLGKPLGTVKSLIHRGKAILRDRMVAKYAVSV